jgi:hypothetical protein
MLKFSALIVMLTLLGSTTAGFSAQDQTKSRQCYNAQACQTTCTKSGVGRNCEYWCQRRAGELSPCK